MKKCISLILAFIFVIGVFATVPLTPIANAASTEGKLGENITWVLDETGTLTLSGTGAIPDFEYNFKAIFDAMNPVKIIINEGITHIGDYTFYGCSQVTNSVSIPKSVTSIGQYAFAFCHFDSILFPKELKTIEANAFYYCNYLEKVCCKGSAEDWANMVILEGNEKLFEATKSFMYEYDKIYDFIFTTDKTLNLSYKADRDFSFVVDNPNVVRCGSVSSSTISWGGSFQKASSVEILPVMPGETIVKVVDVNGQILTSSTILLVEGEHKFEFSEVIKEPTCFENGENLYVCKYCGLEDVRNVESGHNYKTEITKDATCIEPGEKKAVCTKCGDTYTETITSGAHNYSSEFTIDKDPTYDEEGSKSRHCIICDAKTDVTVIEKLPLVLVAPTVKVSNTAEGVKVTWNAVENAQRYCVARSTYDKSTSSYVDPIILSSVYTTSYTDTTAKSGTYYIYVVYGMRGSVAGEAGWAGISFDPTNVHTHKYTSEITKKPTYTETGVKTFTCSCGDSYTEVIPKLEKLKAPTITSVTSEQNGVKFTWSEVNGSEGYIVFKLVQNESGEYVYQQLAVVGASTLAFTDQTAVDGETYCYAVAAMDEMGNAGQYSEFAHTYKKLTTLSTPKVSVKSTSSGVKVSWKAIENAETYTVYRRTYNAKTKKWGAWKKLKSAYTKTSFTDKKAKLGTKYRYTVKAVNGSVTSKYKSTDTIKYNVTPTVKVAKVSNGVKVTWSTAANATSYKIYRSTYNTKTKEWSSWKEIKTAKASSKSYTDKTAKKGVKYRYTVRAVNGSYKSTFKESSLVKR